MTSRGYISTPEVCERVDRSRDTLTRWARGQAKTWPAPRARKRGGLWFFHPAAVRALEKHLATRPREGDCKAPAYSAPAPDAIRWLLTPERAAEAAGMTLERFDRLEAEGKGPTLILYGSGERRYKRREVQRWMYLRAVVG